MASPASGRSNVFLTLPPEIFLLIANRLCARDLASLIVSSSQLSQLYTPTLTRSTDAHGTPLLIGAITQHYHGLAQRLLQLGVSPDTPDTANSMASIHHAVFVNDVPAIELLLRYSASIDARTAGGYSTLHVAATVGSVAVIPTLIAAGADVNAINEDENTALYLAASRGDLPVVKMLIENHADVALADIEGWTPLHCAAVKGFSEVVALLLEQGAPPNSRDIAGQAPLHYACIRGHAEAVRVLLDHGAEVDLDDGFNGHATTAVCLAASAGHGDLVRMLLDAGAEAGLGDALLGAAATGRTAVVEILIESGRDGVMGRVNEALVAATSSKHGDVTLLLLQNGVRLTPANTLRMLRLAAWLGWREVAVFMLDKKEASLENEKELTFLVNFLLENGMVADEVRDLLVNYSRQSAAKDSCV